MASVTTRSFFSPEKGCTFAELETVEKKKISHRAKALAVLKSKLTSLKCG